MRFVSNSLFWKLNKVLLPQGFCFCEYLEDMNQLELEEKFLNEYEGYDYKTTSLGRFKNVETILFIDFSCTFLDQSSKFHLLKNIFKLFNIKNVSNKLLKKIVLNLKEGFYLKRVEFLLYENKFTKFLNTSNLENEE